MQRSVCPCQDGKRGEEALAIAWPGWLPTGFASARFLLATGSPACAVQPPVWLAPLALLPVLDARGGTGLRGLGLRDF